MVAGSSSAAPLAGQAPQNHHGAAVLDASLCIRIAVRITYRGNALKAGGAAASKSNGRRVSLGKLPLMPVRIGGRHVAGNVQSLHLIGRQVPTDRPQILLQLLCVSGTDNHGGYRRTL